MQSNFTNINQTEAISLAYGICPSLIGRVESFFQFIFAGPIKFDTADELARFACLQVNIGQVVYPRLDYDLAMARVIGGALGVLGSIMALIIFARSEYKGCVTMIYHRFVNVVEILNALILIHGGIDSLYQNYLSHSERWVWFNNEVILVCRGSILFTVNMVVLWMACERIAACYTARLFACLNRTVIAWLVIALSVVIATGTALPNGMTMDYYYDNATATYKQQENTFSKTKEFKAYAVFYAIVNLTHSGLLLIASLLATSGFLSMARRKKRLMSTKSRQTQRTDCEKEMLKQYSNNLQLCVLQMCETIPFTLNEIVLAAYMIHYNYVVELKPGKTAPREMAYPEAVRAAKDYEVLYYVQFTINLGVVVSHCLRFYLYIVFSAKVRCACVSMIRRLGGKGGGDHKVNLIVPSHSTVKQQISAIT